MLNKDKIERINFLAKKSKAEGLNKDEKKEQDNLRKEYIKNARESFKSQLDNIKIVD